MSRLLLASFLLYLCHARKIPSNVDPEVKTTIIESSETIPLNESKCKANMIPYPVKDGNEMCDCKTGYLYYELKDECYLPFRRGPCKDSEFFVYDQNKKRGSCVRRPCKEDGMVQFKGKCHKLNTIGHPCGKSEILSVDDEQFQVHCEPLDVNNRNLIQVPVRDPTECPPNTRRGHFGQCREVA